MKIYKLLAACDPTDLPTEIFRGILGYTRAVDDRISDQSASLGPASDCKD